MDKKIIVADAGPLIAFGKIKQIEILVATLGKIIAPTSVIRECLLNPGQLGAKEIAEAITKKWISSHQDITKHHELFDILGVGEVNAILLAAELKMGILIDEKLGRKAAEKMNLKIIGTAGVLLLAKKKKIIRKISPLIQELKNSGYFLSNELIHTVLMRAGET